MSGLMQTVRQSLRQLWRNPGFTLAAVLILALGIGANTALFSVFSGVVLRPLPYAGGDRLVHIRYAVPFPDLEGDRFSVQELLEFQGQSRAFERLLEYHSRLFTLIGRGEPERVRTGVVSAEFFDYFEVEPALGRLFRPDDAVPGAAPVVVLSYEYWQNRFGRDPSILDETLRMNDQLLTVVGVLPPLPRYPDDDLVYIPTLVCPHRAAPEVIHDRTIRAVNLYARLRPETTLEQARTELSTIYRRIRQEYPEVYPPQHPPELVTVPVKEELVSAFRPTLWILLGTVGLVLLLSVANVANLLFARLLSRRRELVLRAALGADRRRLIRQLLSEGLLLSLTGGAVGLLVAAATKGFLVSFARRFTSHVDSIRIDLWVLLFTLGVCLLVGMLIALIPALRIARQDFGSGLREGGGHTTADRRLQRSRNLLLVGQVTGSFILLIGAGLTIRSLIALQRVDPGYNADQVLSLTMRLPYQKYPVAQQIVTFYDALLERLGGHPGVRSVALSTSLPLVGNPWSPGVLFEGRPAEDPLPEVHVHEVSPDYFRTLEIPLLAGRSFTEADDWGASPVAIVTEAMAERFWPDADPLGHRLALDYDPSKWHTVVGVVGDVRQDGLKGAVQPAIYVPFSQVPDWGAALYLRAEGEPESLVPAVRQAVLELNPEQPLTHIRPLAQIRSELIAPTRLTTLLLGLFAAVAFLVTTVGVSGTMTLFVVERTQEIGIRSALGAGRRRLLELVLHRGMLLVLIGLLVGVLAALALTRLLSSVLYGVAPTDPATFALVSLLMLLVAAAACAVPAVRATGIDPNVALRRE